MPNLLESGWIGTGEAPYSRAELYDAAAFGADPLALQWLLEHFEIISRPRQRIGSPLRRGDILLRRGEGSLAHACVIVDPEFRSGLEVSMQGGTVEFGGGGNFLFIAERGARPHEEHERFARRVTDDSGRVLRKQIVLRPREGAGEAERIDPMSIMVGMTLAQQVTAPRPTQVTVVSPTPEKPAGEWAAPMFEGDAFGASESVAAPRYLLEYESENAGAAEFNSPEHSSLGLSIQGMVDAWARAGLVSGGCFVVDADADGAPLALDQWKFFTPDRSHPAQPYGDGGQLRNAHWQWITPNAHLDHGGHAWTPQALKSAVREGSALTLSIGDLVMLSGDVVGSFDDYRTAADPKWRCSPINVALGLSMNDPFAYCLIRRLAFPRKGKAAALDMQMVAQAGSNPLQMRSQILPPKDAVWTTVRMFVDVVNKVRGKHGYHQLLVLSRLQRRKKLMNLQNIVKIAPWVDPNEIYRLSSTALLANQNLAMGTDIDDDAFQIIMTNGAYAELALENTVHFSPHNWEAFEKAHRAALQLVDHQVPVTGVAIEYGPIPADAVARLAFGMHFQTDAFASGHMRTPRAALKRQGSLLAGVMHDLENDLGLLVRNGLGQTWRAFGDSSLNVMSQQQFLLLTAQHGHNSAIDGSFFANRDHAISAVGAAMKQLHYQAQSHFGDTANAALFQDVLRNARGSDKGLLYDDAVRDATPGDAKLHRDDWIAMSIDAKINYMKKHRPIPLPVTDNWDQGTGNHPPLVMEGASGSVLFDQHENYSLDQHLGRSDHVLYQLDLKGASGFSQDITRLVSLAALTPKYAEAWGGAHETRLIEAIEKRWKDKRGIRDAVLRWYADISGLGLP